MKADSAIFFKGQAVLGSDGYQPTPKRRRMGHVDGAARDCGPSHGEGPALKCPVFRVLVEREVAKVNRGLARYETVKRFLILPVELTVDGGELTPTLELKRRVVAREAEIEELYSEV
jgi:hypothetical protein